MVCERNMYSANEAMELVLQSNADDKELTESKAGIDSVSEDEEEHIYHAVIGDGGADFDIIIGYQPQQQTEVEYVDNSQQLVADIYQEEVEINDNLSADNLDNIEIPQKSKKRKRVVDDVLVSIKDHFSRIIGHKMTFIIHLGITKLCQGNGTKQSTIPCYMQVVSMKITHKKRSNHF